MIAAHRAAGGRLPGVRAGSRRHARRRRCTASIATRDSRRTRRRSRRTSPRCFPAAGWRSTRARVCTSRSRRTWVWVGGGMYAPEHGAARRPSASTSPRTQTRLRAHRRVAGVPARASARSTASGCSACRAGFPRIIAAAEYLKYRQFLAGREFPAAFATSPRFYAGVLQRLPSGRAARSGSSTNPARCQGPAGVRLIEPVARSAVRKSARCHASPPHDLREPAIVAHDSCQTPSDHVIVFNGHRRVPPPVNEPIRSYAPGSPERASLKARLTRWPRERIDIPLVIGGKDDPDRRPPRTVGDAARSSARARRVPQGHARARARRRSTRRAPRTRNGRAGRSTIAPRSS